MDERGGGYEEPIPEPELPEPEQPPIYEEYDMADGKPFDESIMNNNLKGLLDSWKSDEMQQARQRQTLQDQINGLFLRQASDALTIANTLAQNNAVITMRINSNGVVLDNLALGGKLSSTDVTSAKLAADFEDTASKAIKAAVAAVPGTGAPSQGTSGCRPGRYPDCRRGGRRSDHGADDEARRSGFVAFAEGCGAGSSAGAGSITSGSGAGIESRAVCRKATNMAPDKEHVFLVQILASVEIEAADRDEAAQLALAEIAHRCESGQDLFVRVEEL